MNPLAVACYLGRTEGIAKLLEYGADPNLRNVKGDMRQPPLMWCFLNSDGSRERAENIFTTEQTPDETAHMLEILLAAGADPNLLGLPAPWVKTNTVRCRPAQGRRGLGADYSRTALHMAIELSNVAAVTALVNAGANVEHPNQRLETPLVIAYRVMHQGQPHLNANWKAQSASQNAAADVVNKLLSAGSIPIDPGELEEMIRLWQPQTHGGKGGKGVPGRGGKGGGPPGKGGKGGGPPGKGGKGMPGKGGKGGPPGKG